MKNTYEWKHIALKISRSSQGCDKSPSLQLSHGAGVYSLDQAIHPVSPKDASAGDG